MDTITVSLGRRSYPIYIGSGLLSDAELITGATDARQILIISNEIVAPLYLERVEHALAERETHALILPDGEQTKSLDTFAGVMDTLIQAGFHRDACIFALGGGVVGDLAGFAAACYQRGIDFVQLPTTLLAQVDSSVGGKTAVNHPAAKNMIGAFHQPVSVIADTDTLATLPGRELAAGLAEVIKYGLIEDAAFFAWLEDHVGDLLALDHDALRHAVARCCEIKADIVAQDEREQGRRALLNLGHTFGHAIEALGGYGRWLHGEAVAVGIVMAAEMSERLGRIDRGTVGRIEALLTRAGLPTRIDGLDPDEMLNRMRLDKKAGSAGLRFILLDRIGAASVAAAPERGIVEMAIRRAVSEAR